MSPLFEDPENDVPLPRRGTAAEGDVRHAREIEDARQPEREVTLNTGVVLALFFALALLCAVFFGFGYSMGRKSVPPPTIAESDNASVTASDANSDTPKPSPASAASIPGYAGTSAGTTDARPSPAKTAPATASTAPSPAVVEPPPRPKPTTESTDVAPGAPVVRVAPAAPPATSSTAPAGTGNVYVQVSAVSHQEDANVLLSALRRRGYTVFTRSDSNDSLIHVQLGPFPSKKDADAMRQRLSGDGYNAILK